MSGAGKAYCLPRLLAPLILWLRYHPEFAAIVGTVVVFIGFAFTAARFLSLDSLANILTVAAELGIVSAGITFLMISGEFDLSVGSTLGVSAMIFALLSKAGWPLFIGLITAILVAAAIGVLNGVITVRLGIPSFITTLGSMMFWRGILLALTGGFPITHFPQGPAHALFALNGKLFGQFRTSAVWFLGISLVLHVVLTRTKYGNAVYATGGSREAARALGIATNRVKCINFIISATLAGLAGCVQFARFLSVDPMRGFGLELEAIAASVIGGTLLTGGSGNLVGTIFGVLLIGMVRSGLVQAGAPAYWYQAFVGLIVVMAVILNTSLRRWASQ